MLGRVSLFCDVLSLPRLDGKQIFNRYETQEVNTLGHLQMKTPVIKYSTCSMVLFICWMLVIISVISVFLVDKKIEKHSVACYWCQNRVEKPNKVYDINLCDYCWDRWSEKIHGRYSHNDLQWLAEEIKRSR
jgi:hypothetical protein